MKKRMGLVIALFVLMAACAVVASGCGDEHTHAWGDVIVIEEATCQKEGLVNHTCQICGKNETAKVGKQPHNVVRDEGVEPTCTSEGLTSGSHCADCGEVLKVREPLAPTGHSWINVQTIVAVDCETDGLISADCMYCGTHDDAVVIPALGHNWSEWIGDGKGTHRRECANNEAHVEEEKCIFDTVEIAATCTSGGYHIHTCADCGDSFEDYETPALGHEWGEWVYNPEEHTHSRVCLRDSSHEFSDVCKYETVFVAEPTCASGGYTLHECTECFGTYTDDLRDPLPHSFGAWEHETVDGKITHTRVCDGCGMIESGECAITYIVVDATCTDGGSVTKNCAVCGYSEEISHTDPLGHSYGEYIYIGSDGDHRHARYCTRTGCESFEESACEMVEATNAPTCTAAGENIKVCKDCMHAEAEGEIPALGHKWGEWTTENGVHVRHCENDYNHTEEGKCDYEERVTPPTCDAAGERVYRCTVCGDEVKEALGEPLGHSYGEWTTDGDGHRRTCQRVGCFAEESGAHEYIESNLCAVCGRDGLEYTRDGAYYAANASATVANAETIIIPAFIDGYPVTKIDVSAFEYNTNLKTVYLPNTIGEIAQLAFRGCTSLTDVIVYGDGDTVSSLKKIGSSAFSGCSALINFELPDSLTTISARAFENCASLSTLTLPESVAEIGAGAFAGSGIMDNPECRIGEAVVLGKHVITVDKTASGVYSIPEGVIAVCGEAFRDAADITGVIIPATVKTFARDAFLGCTGITSVVYLGSFDEWLAIKFANDYASPMQYASELNIAGAVGEVVIPEGVTAIPSGAFRGSAVETVYVPDGVTTIGVEAFKDCSALREVRLPDSVISVGADAFVGTELYNNPDNWVGGALYVDNHLIAVNGDAAESFVIKEGTVTVSPYAFTGAVNTREVIVASTVKFIGEFAFSSDAITGIRLNSEGGYWMARRHGSVMRMFVDESLADYAPIDYVGLFRTHNGVWTHVVFGENNVHG